MRTSLLATHQTAILVSLISGGCPSGQSESPHANQPSHCVYSEWSELETLNQLPSGTVGAEFSLASTRSGELIVAEKRPRSYAPTPPLWHLDDRRPFLFTASGSSLDGPSGRYWFISPRIAVDASGKMHMLWGEAASDQPMHDPAREVASVWHASYDEPSGWTVPQQVYSSGNAERLRWEGVRSVAADRWGGLHTFVGSPAAGMLRLSYADETWTADTVPNIETVAETDVAVSDSGELYVIFSGSPRLSDSELEVRSRAAAGGWVPLNDVYLAIGRVGTDTLSILPISVDRGRSSAPTIHQGKDDQFHLLWGRDVTGDVTPEVIEHVHASGSIDQPSERFELPISGETVFNSWTSAIDACGVVHLLIANGIGGDMPGFLLNYRRWSGSWTDASTLFSSAVTLESAQLLASPSRAEVLVLGSGRLSMFSEATARYALQRGSLLVSNTGDVNTSR